MLNILKLHNLYPISAKQIASLLQNLKSGFPTQEVISNIESQHEALIILALNSAVILLFVFIISVYFTFSISILHPMTEGAHFFQSICLNRLPSPSPYASLYQSLLCGRPLPQNETYDLFIKLGILHLLVISGAHLIFLEHLLSKLSAKSGRLTEGFITLFLLIYLLYTGASPPVVRAFSGFLWKKANRKWKLHLSPILIQLSAGLSVLVLIPEWVLSPSFLLSLLASVLMGIVPSNNRLYQSLGMYLLMAPYFGGICGLSPFSIIANLFIAPVWMYIMFPLTLLLIPFPIFSPLIDSLWSLFFETIRVLVPLDSILIDVQFLNVSSGWSYLLIFAYLGHARKLWKSSQRLSQEEVPG